MLEECCYGGACAWQLFEGFAWHVLIFWFWDCGRNLQDVEHVFGAL